MPFIPDTPARSGRFVPDNPGSVTQDVLQSLPAYGEAAVSSALGIPGDIAKLIVTGTNKIGLTQGDLSKITGSAEVQSAFDRTFGGQYQPKTSVGRAGKLTAELLPAMVGGPESLMTKFATRVAAPAAAATAVGEAVPDELKPWAETATLLISPFAANSAVRNTLLRVSSGALPSTAQIKAARDAIYKIGNMTSTRVQSSALNDLAARLTPLADKYVSEAAFAHDDPKTYRLVKEIYSTARAGLSPQFTQIQVWKHRAGDLFDQERSAANAKMLWGSIQDWLQDPALQNKLIGPQKGIAVQALLAGDEMHKRFKNSALLDQYMQQANLRAGKNYTQAQSATAIRQKFGELANDLAKEPTGKSKMGRFLNEAQKEQINRVVAGSPLMNRAKEITSFAPWAMKGIGANAALTYLASSMLGPWGAAAVGAIPNVIGAGAKALYPYLTKKEAQKAIDLIKMGNPVPGTPTYFPTPITSLRYPPLLGPVVLARPTDDQRR